MQLQELERTGTAVTWPEHFNLETQATIANKRLGVVNEEYKKTGQAGGAPETIKLVRRFLTEGLGQRGGIDELVTKVNPFLDFIEKEPKHLEWIENIATGYLAGCVNQPVAGFSEICAWIQVGQAPTVVEKINAARQLMVLDMLVSFVEKDESLGTLTKAEGNNALLREVHKKLIAEGKIKPWLGITGDISYEGMIKTWLTLEKITAAYNEALTILEKPLEEVAKFLVEGHNYLAWGMIAFSDELLRINQEFAGRKQELEYKQEAAFELLRIIKDAQKQGGIGVSELPETVEGLLVSTQAQFSYYRTLLSGINTNSERFDKIEEILGQLGSEYKIDECSIIATEINNLTTEAVNAEKASMAAKPSPNPASSSAALTSGSQSLDSYLKETSLLDKLNFLSEKVFGKLTEGSPMFPFEESKKTNIGSYKIHLSDPSGDNLTKLKEIVGAKNLIADQGSILKRAQPNKFTISDVELAKENVDEYLRKYVAKNSLDILPKSSVNPTSQIHR